MAIRGAQYMYGTVNIDSPGFGGYAPDWHDNSAIIYIKEMRKSSRSVWVWGPQYNICNI